MKEDTEAGAPVDGEDVQAEVGSEGEKSDESKPSGNVAPPLEVLPQILWLLTQSPQHKYMFLADMEWYFIPPFQLKQFRVFHKDNAPMAYACWAFVSDEVDERMSKGVIRLRPDEWRSGENAWLIDLVAPFGGGEVLLEKLKEQVFKGHKVKTLMPDENGKPTIVKL